MKTFGFQRARLLNRGQIPNLPSSLSVAPAIWVSGRSNTLFKTDGSSAGNTDAIKTWIRPGDSLVAPAFNYGVQASSGDQPPCAVSSGKYHVDGGTLDSLPMATPLALTGEFTAWFVGKRAITSIWTPLGQSNGNNDSITIYSDNNVYVQSAGGSVSAAYTGTNGALASFLVRRTAADAVYFRASGMAEASMGTLAGTLNYDLLMGRVAFATFTTAGNWLSDAVVMLAAATEKDYTIMAAYHSAEWGVSL